MSVLSDPAAEVHRQADLYIERGYPGLAGLSDEAFAALIEPLAALAADLSPDEPERSRGVPLLLVITDALIAPAVRQELTHLDGSARRGIVDRNHGDEGLSPYFPLAELDLPAAPAYLLTRVERGEEFCNVAPKDAVATIAERGRSPLTVDEGISLTTVFPELLEKNKCFMLAGSRRGDKRVPAMWIADKAPKLGWCWEGNPHSWLGVASAGSRRAALS